MSTKIITEKEQIYFDSNTIFFSDKVMKERFTKTFNVEKSFGNLTGFVNKVPLIVLDIAPCFNIKNHKIEEKDEILENFVLNIKEFPYFTHIYKDNSINKNNIIIEENEEVANNIISAFKEVQFIIDNIYSKMNDIIIIHFGKYAEYKYLFNMLFLNTSNRNIHTIYFKHPSYYLEKDSFENCKSFIADVNKIKKIMKEC